MKDHEKCGETRKQLKLAEQEIEACKAVNRTLKDESIAKAQEESKQD